MKLKYYLRGLGIGIIVTTIILIISFSKREVKISDDEVIARAMQLGMVMQETQDQNGQESDTEQGNGQEPDAGMDPEDGQETGTETKAEDGQEPDAGMNPEDGQNPDSAANEPQESDAEDGLKVQTGNPAGEGSYRLVIQKGDVCRVVCENLAANGVITDAEALRKYLFQIGYASNMSVGEYDIPYNATNEEVAAILQAGPLEDE